MNLRIASVALLLTASNLACSSDDPPSPTPDASDDRPGADVTGDLAESDVPPANDVPPVNDVPPANDVPPTLDVPPMSDVPPARDAADASDVADATDAGADVAVADSGNPDGCARPPTPWVTEFPECNGRTPGMCPAGYTCTASAGIVLSYSCRIPCRTDCECPVGGTCDSYSDKAGMHQACVRH